MNCWLEHMRLSSAARNSDHAGDVGRLEPVAQALPLVDLPSRPPAFSHRSSCRSVITQPGTTQLTRMRSGPSSRASAARHAVDRGFRGDVGEQSGSPTIQVIEPKLMIEPPPRLAICGRTACAAKNWWRRFTAMRSSQYSTVTSSVRWRSSLPALLHRA